jgi:hypothetical protein
MTELRCETHQAVAGWKCTVCERVLCPDCTAYKYVPPTRLTVCVLCGELAEPLLRERTVKETLVQQLPGAFQFPLRGDAPALWLGLTFFFFAASYAGASFAAWVLSLGTFFALIRGTASGHDALELSDFRDPLTSMFLPAARFAIAMLPAWAGVLATVLTGETFWSWLAVLVTVVWAPVNVIAAARDAHLGAMLDPRRVFGAVARIGGDYVPYLGGLAAAGVLWFLAFVLGEGLRHSALYFPFITPLLTQALLAYPPLVGARIAGLVLRRHPQAFGSEDTERFDSVLGDLEPRGVLPEKTSTLPSHLPSEIELPPEAPPQLPEAGHRFAAMEVSGAAEAPAEVAPLDVRMLPGIGEQSTREIRTAMRASDIDTALDVFRATGLSCVDQLNVDELLWLGQVAGARIDYESALLALEHAAKKDAAPEAKGKSWVMLGRLLGEKLNRRDEAVTWMNRVVAELPKSSAADFARKWLAT